MGTGMSKIISGVYIGNIKDSKDIKTLTENQISHILAVHDNAKELIEDKIYLCIIVSDSPQQSLIPHFEESIDFIHKARNENGRVLIHCLAGISRSVTFTAAYIMTVTNFGWRESLNAIRGGRQCANPNFGFQRQLQEYEQTGLAEARLKLKEKYPNHDYEKDEQECQQLLKAYHHYLFHGDQCDGKNCSDHDFMVPQKNTISKNESDSVESDSTDIQ
ncbi:unnamed protein product [Acanthosepion pharaonis]|uniref:Dual specificity protein phosphatase 15 n=1 Tax=Acanthosepion pharaonis TaxID=158019 RepID=A0A812DNP5_ACAPH|nr:unnamed protein product [Sepia pharaonis]